PLLHLCSLGRSMAGPGKTMLGDIGGIWQRRKELWRLISRADKLGLIAGVLIMALVAAGGNRIASLLGWCFYRVAAFVWRPISEFSRVVFVALGVLAGAYIFKESLNLLRRCIVTRTTTAIERNMTVRLVGHLLKVDLGALARERIGSLHGRISRCVEGYVKFL